MELRVRSNGGNLKHRSTFRTSPIPIDGIVEFRLTLGTSHHAALVVEGSVEFLPLEPTNNISSRRRQVIQFAPKKPGAATCYIQPVRR